MDGSQTRGDTHKSVPRQIEGRTQEWGWNTGRTERFPSMRATQLPRRQTLDTDTDSFSQVPMSHSASKCLQREGPLCSSRCSSWKGPCSTPWFLGPPACPATPDLRDKPRAAGTSPGQQTPAGPRESPAGDISFTQHGARSSAGSPPLRPIPPG